MITIQELKIKEEGILKIIKGLDDIGCDKESLPYRQALTALGNVYAMCAIVTMNGDEQDV